MSKKNLITIVASVSLIMFFVCGQVNAQKGKPLYLAYDSEDVIRDQSQVATITSTCGLIIDGIVVSPKSMRSANTGFLKKQIVNADVLPGVHGVTVTHTPSGESLQTRTTTTTNTNEKTGITTTTTTVAPVQLKPITYNFEAGRIYVVEIHLLTIRIREVTKEKSIAKIAETRNNAVFENKK